MIDFMAQYGGNILMYMSFVGLVIAALTYKEK